MTLLRIDDLARAFEGRLRALRMLRAVLAAGVFATGVMPLVGMGMVVAFPEMPLKWKLVFSLGLPAFALGGAVLEFVVLRAGAMDRRWVWTLIRVLSGLWFLGQLYITCATVWALRSVEGPLLGGIAIVLSLGLQVYIYGQIWWGFRDDHEADRDAGRGVLADRRYGISLRTDIYRVLGLPIARNNFRLEVRLALALALAAFLLEGIAFHNYIQAFQNVSKIIRRGDLVEFLAFTEELGKGGVSLYFLLTNVLGAQLSLIGVRVIRRATRRLTIQSVQEIRKVDERPPVLLLRTFRDDQVSLKKAKIPWHVRLFDPSVQARNLEELIVLYFPEYGPVIAIGNPEDRAQPSGAAREYVDSEKWKATVLGLIDESRWIIVAVERTPNILWELAAIHERGAESRTVVIFPPGATRDSELQRLVLQALAVPENEIPLELQGGVHRLALWRTTATHKALLSSRVSEVEYELAFRMLLDDWLSGPNSPA